MTRLKVDGVTIRFGGLTALDGVSFSVSPGEIFALIGPNGAGKTTLFNGISGVYRLTEGRVAIDDEDIVGLAPFQLALRGMTRTFQNLQIFFRLTAIENVMVGRHLHERRNLVAHFLGFPSVRRQNQASRSRAGELLAFVGLGEVADQLAGELPYGMLKRLEIARALAVEPRILLLDEPVAGCNAAEIAEIGRVIRKIADGGVSVVLVEHDIHLIMTLADRIHVLDRGKTLAEGTPAEIRSNPAVIAAYLGTPPVVEVEHAVG